MTATGPASAQDIVVDVTFTRDVLPIMQRAWQQCHRPSRPRAPIGSCITWRPRCKGKTKTVRTVAVFLTSTPWARTATSSRMAQAVSSRPVRRSAATCTTARWVRRSPTAPASASSFIPRVTCPSGCSSSGTSATASTRSTFRRRQSLHTGRRHGHGHAVKVIEPLCTQGPPRPRDFRRRSFHHRHGVALPGRGMDRWPE